MVATAAGCASIRGTDSISDTSRTGAIHTVNFEERMTPTNLRVQPGDEVRWVNQRSTAVTVEFLGEALDDVTCQTGFSSLLRRQQETATINPNESATDDLFAADVYQTAMQSAEDSLNQLAKTPVVWWHQCRARWSRDQRNTPVMLQRRIQP